jgi:hypothetical protein
MAMKVWREKIILNEGELQRHDRSFNPRFMQEEDVDLSSIRSAMGPITGKIQVTDYTAVKEFAAPCACYRQIAQ